MHLASLDELLELAGCLGNVGDVTAQLIGLSGQLFGCGAVGLDALGELSMDFSTSDEEAASSSDAAEIFRSR